MDNDARKPQISVIIPVYNGEETVIACLASIATAIEAAPACVVEVICVDDGSQDGTWEKLTQCTDLWPWLSCYRQSNGGVSMARNRGLDSANGEYVTFVDADDTVDENIFEALLPMIIDHYDCILFAMRLIWPDGSNSLPKGVPTKAVEGNSESLIYAILNPSSPYKGYAFGKLVRRDLIEGGNWAQLRFDSTIRFLEDTWFWLHAALRCNHVIMLSKVLYNYLKNPTGTLAGCSVEDSFEELDLRRKICHFMREVSPANAHDSDLDYMIKCAALVRLFYVEGDHKSLIRLRSYWNEAFSLVRNGGGYSDLDLSRCFQIVLCRLAMLLRLPIGFIGPFRRFLAKDKWLQARVSGGLK